MTVTNNFNKSRKILGVNLRHINTPNNKSLINIINTNEINTRRILGNKPRRILGVKLRHINTPRNKTIKNILKTDFGNKIKNVFGVNLKHVEMPNNKSLKNIVRKNEINSKKILGNKMKTVLGVNLRHVKMPNNKTLKNRVDIKEINSKRILERTTPEGKAINTFKKPVLIVHHDKDECRVTKFSDLSKLSSKLNSNNRNEVVIYSEGITQGDACQAMSHHGFNGIEQQVVSKIVDWVIKN